MKKTNIIVNTIESTITVTKAFYKRASVYGSAEYVEFHSAVQDNPDFEIVFKVVEKKTYGGLTFGTMTEYIKTQPNSERMLVKMAAVMRVAKAKNSLYPLTKKWFLATYPSYKENAVAETEAAALVKKAEAEAEAAAQMKQAEAEIADLIAEDNGNQAA